jgi:hypothetical protein
VLLGVMSARDDPPARSAAAGGLLGRLDAARALTVPQVARPRGVAAAAARYRPAAHVAAGVAGAFRAVASPVGVAGRAAPLPPWRRRAPDFAVAALAAQRAGAPRHDYPRRDTPIAPILLSSVIAARGPVGESARRQERGRRGATLRRSARPRARGRQRDDRRGWRSCRSPGPSCRSEWGAVASISCVG